MSVTKRKTGDCYAWFKKHYVDKDFYDNPNYHPYVITPIVMPTDAAPMIYGLSEYNFSNHCELWETATSSAFYTIECESKNNYKGFFIWDYHEAIKTIPSNVLNCVVGLNCNNPPASDNSNVIEEREFIIWLNPVVSQLNIEGLNAGEYYEIYDTYQVLHLKSKERSIYLNDFESGIYLIKIYSGNGLLLKSSWLLVNHK